MVLTAALGVSQPLPRAALAHLISRWKDGGVRGTAWIPSPEEAGLEPKPGHSASRERLSCLFSL